MSETPPPIDFAEITARLRDAVLDRRRVLTVPVWGWTGDGKTCSILTIYKYADSVEHGIGLDLVSDTTELEEAVGGVAVYEPLRLPELGRASGERLSNLAEVFLDNHRWPPGTDAPTPYLVRLTGVRETFGFLYLPDLQGGSFQANDGAARAVLASADACAIMVDPLKYAGSDVESKKYRGEVDYRVKGCVDAGISAAVMLTKVDRSSGPDTAAVDKAHLRLSIVVSGAANVRVFLVSVLGEGVELDGDGQPPPVDKRNPAALLQAWMWLLSQALLRTPESAHRAPPVRLSASTQQAALPTQRVAEVRNMGTFSSPPGRVLCAVPSTGGPAFLMLAGEALGVATVGPTGDKPAVQQLGRAPGLADVGDFEGVVVGGEVFIGERFGANALWHGRTGDDLAKIGLPLELRCWCVTAGQRVAGVDASGRAHLYKREGDRWHQVSYVADFIPKSEGYVCAWLPRERALVVANGEATLAIEVRDDGFGDRVTLPVELTFDMNDTVRISPLGLTVHHPHQDAASTACLGDVRETLAVDADLSDLATAVAPDAPLAACIDAEKRLHVVRLVAGASRHVIANGVVPGDPTGMAWAMGSPWLLITFAESWSLFSCRGFDE